MTATSVAPMTRRGAAISAQRPQRGQPGEHADREDLADEALAEADPGHRGGRDREPVRAERVTGVGRRAEPAAQPLGPGEVQPEVVVEADAEQPPAPGHREGEGEDDRDHDRRRQPDPERARRRVVAPPPGDRRAATTIRTTMPMVALVPWPGARARTPETVRIAREADRGLEPAPAPPPGEREDRPADQERGQADQRRRDVGPDHQQANLWQRERPDALRAAAAF